MIDLRNTWCEKTFDNYKALEKSSIKVDWSFNRYNNRFIINSELILFGDYHNHSYQNKRKIHLVDGEFQYVKEDTILDSFNKHGFETPEFEGEILGTTQTKHGRTLYIGVLHKGLFDNCPCMWSWDGSCYDSQISDSTLRKYSLTPIKKPWYEDELNIGKLCVYTPTGKMFTMLKTADCNCIKRNIEIDNFDWVAVSKCRPATEEEVLSLLIKE